MELKEKVEKQIAAGFTQQEIYNNLILEGHSQTEIDTAYGSTVTEHNRSNTVSTKSILLGLLFLVIVIFRIARFANGGGVFLFLSILTGIGMMIYFFTRRGR